MKRNFGMKKQCSEKEKGILFCSCFENVIKNTYLEYFREHKPKFYTL